MKIFQSETNLLQTLDRYDDLVRQCVDQKITFDEFCDLYNHFYSSYALDGHESDAEERALFERHAERIQAHAYIAQQILARLCSEEKAGLQSYKNAGRIGPATALEMLADVNLFWQNDRR
ncbi:hypothetical protein RF679_15610 [Undibacterium cyanobacteriorum]|uniref:Uncharacterized protein n=1 Tax=Undibacterium cyanobacteriorum TaxID=3073561 RepID=A0ABY9RFR1_9BURK|nr:hypothetical protein [Undibacterium sp. 20NA77.5]WMW80060.1 hypothetical protein RF679_15610 [Undibacterium sp. 20NA77.5]